MVGASTLVDWAAKGSGRGREQRFVANVEADQSGIVVDEDSSVALHRPLIDH